MMKPFEQAIAMSCAAVALVLGNAAVAGDAGPAGLTATEVQALMGSFSESSRVFTQTGGKNIYAALCAGCHMPQGEGAAGVGFYPKLADNPRLAASAYPLAVVITGLHGMPSFAHRLNDAQVADVVNYVRTHFGNNYPGEVTARQVAELREQAAPDPRSSYDFNEY